MILKTMACSALALMLTVPAVHAQTAPAANPAQPANAVNPGAIQALKDMGAHLQSLKRFGVSVDVTGERVLQDGQKLQHTATADLDVARPDKLYAKMSSARSTRELFYNGKVVTLWTPAQMFYSSVEFGGNLDDLVEKLEARYGIEVPLSDLFLWGTPNAPVDKIDSAMNAGQDFVGRDLCDHYAFRQGMFDWQIWITTGAKPLPRKLVIVNRSDDARPQSTSVIDWELQPTFKNAVFTFTPPKGAKKVELVPLKAK